MTLEEARAEAAARVAALTAQLAGIVETASASSGDDEHDPEGQTIAYDRAQVAALLAAARRDLEEVDAARARVEAGTYGVCERCGRPIAPERLEARPAARTCVPCADRRT
ncbi:TraR/DksA family transcriptional regulator [Actinomycetospora straminea]|uniref:TraR/DksA C4-type zinc finger protein n=1 Tax=Actinomycetospora straminea TaxID=663607 RepID=A0ABP9EN43_9PSEU|nr:TraR/DksA C4-type zinc finger protein [Actinomycetospora straminea]MDD7935006.1 TraR/DksA C4-type zinc finger protein [Actinomycetospora straminea]